MGASAGAEVGAKPPRVGILGGGPAGAFCAIWLGHISCQTGSLADITVFDHKSFDKPGPAGCNMCAGIIPDSLVRNLHGLGIELPEHVIQRRLEGYVLHARGGSVEIPTPPGATTYATFRGPGPLGMYPARQEGFDWWVLSEAQQRGARHIGKAVKEVIAPSSRDGPFTVICRDDSRYEFDVVVGAFGVNSNLADVFARLGFGYRGPHTERARQAEIPLDPDFIQHHLRNRVHILATGVPGLRFAAITPKRRHVTVTLIGRNPSRQLLEEMLQSREVRACLPPDWELPAHYCSCAPRLPHSPAANPVGDRLLVIGDANISRYLKNGIESSFHSARWAAEAICAGDLTRRGLRRYYLLPCARLYRRDNLVGRAVFRAHDLISRSTLLTRAHLAVARQEQASGRTAKPLSEVYWGLFTGALPYRTLLRKALQPGLQLRLVKAFFATLATRGSDPQLAPTETGTATADKTVIIVGGGPAGSSCAIHLARASHAAGRPARVVLIEGKNFGEHQNQDGGLLSPPGEELLAEVLGEAPPERLFQRRIKGYVLHGGAREIRLDGDELGEHPVALRRVEVDSLLLEKARAEGVEVVQARATDLEVGDDGVVVYTEGDSFRGDILVGAFALDETMARATSKHTHYRPPLALETLACKIHPAGLDPLPGLLGDCVHVFLPRLPGVEFAALIPKGNHITAIVAGASLEAHDMERFLRLPQVVALVGPSRDVRGYYKGRFPLGPARASFDRRYVMIGDAAGLVRPFKGKGVNSALEGGRLCAETLLEGGLSRDTLSRVARGQRHLARDVWFGRFVRRLVVLIERLGWLDVFIEEADRNQPLRQVLFDCISGRTTYRDVVLRRTNLAWLPRIAWRCALRTLHVIR